MANHLLRVAVALLLLSGVASAQTAQEVASFRQRAQAGAVWRNSAKTFMDPACGTGNFLVEVVAHKIQRGSTPTQALLTTYGVELMPDNARLCRERLLDVAGDTNVHRAIVGYNIACANALEFDYWKSAIVPLAVERARRRCFTQAQRATIGW